MKFAIATSAPPPCSLAYQIIAWVYAAVLVIMVVGQLFSFEKFIPLMYDYWLPGGNGTATLIASLVVVSEVFALPFLLRMPLSPLMRVVSMSCSLLAASIWVLLGVVAVAGNTAMENSGMLGVKVVVPSGMVQLGVAIMLGVLAAVSVRGLWPHHKE